MCGALPYPSELYHGIGLIQAYECLWAIIWYGLAFGLGLKSLDRYKNANRSKNLKTAKDRIFLCLYALL
jgi:hypothetical protein